MAKGLDLCYAVLLSVSIVVLLVSPYAPIGVMGEGITTSVSTSTTVTTSTTTYTETSLARVVSVTSTTTSTILIPTAISWITTIQPTTTNIATTTTVTTRIWTAALTDYFALPLLALAFFTTYGTFATFGMLRKKERYNAIAGLFSLMVGGGVGSSLLGQEGIYFYLTGMTLAGVIWWLVDRARS